MNKTVIQTKDLCKTYIVEKQSNNVLQNVNLKVEEGEFVSIMGPSGSGKSTLLYTVSGMDRATAGEVIFDGEIISGKNEKEMSYIRLTKMGFIFQQMYMMKKLCIMDNIVLPGYQAKLKSREKVNEEAEKLMRRLEIIDTAERRITEEFVVTAFFDGQSWGAAPIIMSEAFEGAVSTGNALYQYKLDCLESEYQEYYDRMDALFTDDEIKFKGSKDAYDEFFAGFSSMFNLLILVVSVVVAVVLSLITIMYENIFMEEETGDVAVLKSIGFQNGVIKCWHLFRMLLLVAASYVVAIIFSKAIGNYVIGNIVNHIIHVCEFEMITLFWANYVIVPVSVILLLALCMLTVLQAVNRIQIWRIRDE